MEPHEGCKKKTRKEEKHIPHEIVRDILLTLPVKSLLRFKAVCKPWRTLISDPDFVKSRLNLATKDQSLDLQRYGVICLEENRPYQPNDYFWESSVSFSSINSEVWDCEEVQLDFVSEKESVSNVEILGSCNGLLLINTNYNTFVWNPSTREYKELYPPKDFRWLMEGYAKISGLGYDSSLDKYKAVIVIHVRNPPGSDDDHDDDYDDDDDDYDHNHNDDDKFDEVHISLIKGDSSGWERGQWLDYGDFDHCIYSGSLGVTLNGAPHWVVGSSRKNYHSNSRAIIYFDVAEEKFKRVPQPKLLENTKFDLTLLEESLCIIHNNVGTHVDIWAMKEYGLQESWTKLFVIQQSMNHLKPLGFLKNGDDLLMEINKKKLVTYNLSSEDESFTPIMLAKNKCGFKVVAYVESLVSP